MVVALMITIVHWISGFLFQAAVKLVQQCFQGSLHNSFILCIKCTGGFIQEQHPYISDLKLVHQA